MSAPDRTPVPAPTQDTLLAEIPILGLMGTVVQTVLEHGYGLPAALTSAVAAGAAATALVQWILTRTTSSGGPRPPALA